jgi:hypothetical protein
MSITELSHVYTELTHVYTELTHVYHSCHAVLGANSEIVNSNPARSNSSTVVWKLWPRDCPSVETYQTRSTVNTTTATFWYPLLTYFQLHVSTTMWLSSDMSHTDFKIPLLQYKAVERCKFSRAPYGEISKSWPDGTCRCFGSPEDGDSMFFRIFGIYLQVHTASQPRTTSTSSLS